MLSLPVTSIAADDEARDAEASLAPVPLVDIANAIVHVYKETFGRGPTKARARLAGPDILVVLLEDIMTVAERNLLERGEVSRVHDQRLFLQRALEDRKRLEVERILERRPLASICGVDPSRDLAAEIFTLEPNHRAAAEQIREHEIG
jgi:uncharacterized protein YbcI